MVLILLTRHWHRHRFIMVELFRERIDHPQESSFFDLKVLDGSSVLRVHTKAATTQIDISLDLLLVLVGFSGNLLHSLSQIG